MGCYPWIHSVCTNYCEKTLSGPLKWDNTLPDRMLGELIIFDNKLTLKCECLVCCGSIQVVQITEEYQVNNLRKTAS